MPLIIPKLSTSASAYSTPSDTATVTPTDSPVRFGSLKLPFSGYHTVAAAEGLLGWVLITVFIGSLGKTWMR